MGKTYIVNPDELYCTWEVDISKLEKNTVVLAGEGTQVIHYVNGTVENTYYPDDNTKKSRLIIKTRQSKDGSEVVVGVNTDKEFSVAWGVGGVPYTDKKYKLDTFAGMNGEFKFKVQHYPSLIGALGKTSITPADVKNFTAAKLQEALTTRLASRLVNKKYEEVALMQSVISDDIKYDYENVLKSIGIKLTSFSLKEIFFPDDYLKARGERSERGAYGIYSAEKAASTEAPKAPEISEIKPDIKPETREGAKRFCPYCGKEAPEGTAFCARCGAKL